jgi:hypothetical protein
VREERTTNYTKRSDPDELGLWIDGRMLKLCEYVDEIIGYQMRGLGKARLRGVDWKGQMIDWLKERGSGESGGMGEGFAVKFRRYGWITKCCGCWWIITIKMSPGLHF